MPIVGVRTPLRRLAVWLSPRPPAQIPNPSRKPLRRLFPAVSNRLADASERRLLTLTDVCCRLLPTLRSFLAGVRRAILYTPLFCMLAGARGHE